MPTIVERTEHEEVSVTEQWMVDAIRGPGAYSDGWRIQEWTAPRWCSDMKVDPMRIVLRRSVLVKPPAV